MDRFLLRLILLLTFPPVVFYAENSTSIDSINRLLEKSVSDSSRALLLIELAKNYSLVDYAPAMKYADMAVDEAMKAESDFVLQEALNRAGDIHMKAGLFDVATVYFSRSLDLARKTGNQSDILITYINMGAICMGARDFTKASIWFIKGMSLAEKIRDERHDSLLPVQTISIYNNLSIISRERGNLVKALEYSDLSINLCRKYPTKKRTLTRLLIDRGNVLVRMNQLKSAEVTLKEALKISKSVGDSTQMILALSNMGSLLNRQQKYYDAIAVLMTVLHSASKMNDLVSISNSTLKLSDIYSRIGPADSAVKYLSRYLEDDRKVKISEASSEMIRQELIAKHWEREESTKAANNLRFRKIVMATIFVAIVTVLFVIFFIRSVRKNRKIKNQQRSIERVSEVTRHENELLTSQLEEKVNQLAMKAMSDIKRNEIITNVVEKLQNAKDKIAPEKPEEIARMIQSLKRTKNDKIWEEFDIRFQQTQEGFYSRLHKVCPQLSANERRLCAFLRLNMSTKEIASMTGQSILSIHKSRNRLRQKLNITHQNIGLVEFIASV